MAKTRGRIYLEAGKPGAYLDVPPGPIDERSFLWIGDEAHGCYGVIPDRDVKRLKAWVDKIVSAQKRRKRKHAQQDNNSGSGKKTEGTL